MSATTRKRSRPYAPGILSDDQTRAFALEVVALLHRALESTLESNRAMAKALEVLARQTGGIRP
jgi:hypothetical protein